MTSFNPDSAASVVRADVELVTTAAADAFAKLSGKRLLITGGAAARILGTESIDYLPDLEAAIGGADAVVVVTPWPEFDRLPAIISALASQPLVVDGRRAFDKHDFSRYTGIGL